MEGSARRRLMDALDTELTAGAQLTSQVGASVYVGESPLGVNGSVPVRTFAGGNAVRCFVRCLLCCLLLCAEACVRLYR